MIGFSVNILLLNSHFRNMCKINTNHANFYYYRVFDDAPRLPSDYQITPKQENGVNHYHNRQRYNERRSGYDRSRYRRSEQEHRSDHHRNQGRVVIQNCILKRTLP